MTERSEPIEPVITGPIEQACLTGEIEAPTMHSTTAMGSRVVEQVLSWTTREIPGQNEVPVILPEEQPEGEHVLLSATRQEVISYLSSQLKQHHQTHPGMVMDLSGVLTTLGEFLAIDLYKLEQLTNTEKRSIVDVFRATSNGKQPYYETPTRVEHSPTSTTPKKVAPEYKREIDGKSRAAGEKDD